MFNRRSFLRLIPLGFLLGRGTAPGARGVDSPEEAAKAAFEVMTRADADAVLAAVSPEGLARFRKALMPVVSAAVRDGHGDGVRGLFGIAPGRLDRLDDAAFFRAYWDGLMALLPGFQESIAGASILTYGVVMEGENTAHVPYRILHESGWIVPILVPRVATLHRHEGGWALELGGSFEGIAPPDGHDQALPRVTGSTVQPLGYVVEEEANAYVLYRCRMTFDGGGTFGGVYAYRVHRDDQEWPLVLRREWKPLIPVIRNGHGITP